MLQGRSPSHRHELVSAGGFLLSVQQRSASHGCGHAGKREQAAVPHLIVQHRTRRLPVCTRNGNTLKQAGTLGIRSAQKGPLSPSGKGCTHSRQSRAQQCAGEARLSSATELMGRFLANTAAPIHDATMEPQEIVLVARGLWSGEPPRRLLPLSV